ncbi:MAG: ABC transporter ATP-binding protein [Tissierellia bacterium]|nr:ABC transporter ATP-binding protein [Tissierellia bacterium]
MRKHLKYFFDKYKFKYIIGAISLIVDYIITLFPAYALGKIIDHIVNDSLTFDYLKFIIIAFIACIIIDYIACYLWAYIFFKASDVICFMSRKRVVNKILHSSPHFFEKFSSGTVLTRCTDDVSSLNNYAGFAMMSLFDATVYPLVYIIAMIIVGGFKLTIFSSLSLLILLISSNILTKKIDYRWKKAQQSYDKLNEDVLETVEGIRVIRAYNNQKIRSDNFDKKTLQLYDRDVELKQINSLFSFFSIITRALMYSVALLYGGYLIINNNITVGALATVTGYLNELQWPMMAVGDFISTRASGIAAAKRQNELVNDKDIMVSGEEMISTNPDIEFKNFSFRYPNSDLILKDINFKIRRGQKIGILGKTASGKTTLVKQLLRFYPIEEESLFLNQRDISSFNINSIRDLIGYVSQEHMIFSETIEENIKRGNRNATKTELINSCKIADFHKDVKEFSKGYETLTGENGVSLSGGQKQRLSIARAIIKNPEILILDDALSAVDRKTESEILSSLDKIRKDKTTIIVTHRISQVKDADKIIVLDNGEIKEMGCHDQLIKNDGWYSREFRRQRLEQE